MARSVTVQWTTFVETYGAGYLVSPIEMGILARSPE
jgi:hypothetical protein